MEFVMRPIGTVRSPQNEMSKGGWARIESRIELAPEYEEIGRAHV